MENSSQRTKSLSSDIHDKVARIYYSHGLFCSSHPYSVIFVTLSIFLLCCYPLIHLPLLGSSFQHYSTPVQDYMHPNTVVKSENYQLSGPHWFKGPPISYIQQIIIKSALSPWKSDLILMDAFRAPLAYAFDIHELINNFQLHENPSNTTSLADVCLQVSEPMDQLTAKVLPHYGCLIISPSNIWNNDLAWFKQDPDIIKTIFQQKDSTLDATNFREILFGVPFKESGIKQIFFRKRPRIITYAFTIAFRTYDAVFLQRLSRHLKSKFPLNPYSENITYSPEESDIFHIQFQDLHTLVEFVPLGIAYIILFLYIYFSVCKMELVKSKWALAISAVMTVMMSLLMSVGLCLWFGLNPTLNGSEILPYLIVVIGLENMLVLTKSVLSTPVHLDVKLRVAQGLSKEGWSITKNLLTELALLMVAFLTFVPKIQEFCLFAVVGLLTDFFLQLVFFATFLSIDIRRIEVTDLQRNYIRDSVNVKSHPNVIASELQNQRNQQLKSVPLNCGQRGPPNSSTKVVAPPATPLFVKLPKRMKFIYFWARTRMVQRGLMVCLVMWIFLLLYSSGIIEKYVGGTSTEQVMQSISEKPNSTLSGRNKPWTDSEQIISEFSKNVVLRLKHHNLHLWQSLPPQHWTTLFGYFNISLSGRFISVLPPIHLSVAVHPSSASELRHPQDSRHSYWPLSSSEAQDGDFDDLLSPDLTYHPSSPGEVALAIALVVPSLLFFVYLLVILYRCMCSRHYAEWRTSWKTSAASELNSYAPVGASDTNLVMETFPIKLQGHSQELEFISADSQIVVSCCLDGNVNVWDAISGECVASIHRSPKSRHLHKKGSVGHKCTGSFSSDSTYSSSPQSDAGEYIQLYREGAFSSPQFSSPQFSSPQFSSPQFSSPQFSSPQFSSPQFSSPQFSSFRKEFNFDDADQVATENRPLDQRYDFSQFVVASGDEETGDVLGRDWGEEDVGTHSVHSTLPPQPVWSLDHYGCCVAVGCKDGRIELWNALTGDLEYVHEESDFGVVMIQICEDRLVAGRVNGVLEFFVVDISSNANAPTYTPCTDSTSRSVIRCSWLQSARAHSLAVSALEVGGGLVVSGGVDRLVKVFRSDSTACAYTLHGHTAPISVLNIDPFSPSSAASGCQDGLVCLWDLMTGTCMYSLTGHQGMVTSLQSTDIYMISQGSDSRICIWEKCQGHLLHDIHQDYSLHSNLLLLTNNIMVTTKEDHLVVWDVNHGEALRMIMVGSGDHAAHVRLLRRSGQSVVCDCGPRLFIVSFPALSDKSD